MAGFGDAIKNLYNQFILRDVLSFITPGAIIVLTAVFLFYPDLLDRYTPWPFYIPLFGLFFIVGFAIQCLGEIIGFVRIHLLAKSDFKQRLSLFRCKKWECTYDKKLNIWWDEAYEELAKLWLATKCDNPYNDRARQGHERIVVLRQMCANNLLATIGAGIFLAVSYIPWTLAKLSVLSIVALLFLASLFWGYRVHLLRGYTLDKKIIEYHGKDSVQSSK